jgi:GntR family transcriptional regulator
MIGIDRDSPIPFYYQLAQRLKGEIEAERWAEGERLPSEAELCETFDLSRSVIRQALGVLESDGLIRKSKGRGAFVTAAAMRSWLLQSAEGFFEDETGRRGASVRSRLLRAEREQLPLWAAERLGLEASAKGVTLERLRWVDDQLALYVVNHLPDRLAPVALGLGDDESLYARLAQNGTRVAGGHRTLEAVDATAKLAKLLEIRRGASLIFIQSTSWTSDRLPFDCYRAWVRTDRMRIEMTVSAPSATSASGVQDLLRPPDAKRIERAWNP